MSKHDLQNERLDQIGRSLLEAVKTRDEEIERIVASAYLFDSVKAGIKTERARREGKRFFNFRTGFQLWSWQKTASVLAILAIFVGLAGAIIFIKRDVSPPLAERINVPEIQAPIAPVEIPQPQPVNENLPKFEKTKIASRKNPIPVKRANFKNEAVALRKPKRKADFIKRQTEIEALGEFYAITYAGNLGESGEDLQIIRTELSRSSLFALGVNLSLENESEKLKTDLLIGSDGIPRAIRFVK